MGTAYLIRHAEPVPPHVHSGPDIDRPLSDHGRRQAAWIAARLAGSGAALVLTSPYVRCSETAAIIADQLGIALRVDATLHIASGFALDPSDRTTIFVAHSNNIPVAMADIGAQCHACAHASCWTVKLDDEGRATSAVYTVNQA